MLKHTLGCPNTFELRRKELAHLAGVSSCDVNDEAVVESCVAEVRPGRRPPRILERVTHRATTRSLS